MFSYPSILLFMSLAFAFVAGHFSSLERMRIIELKRTCGEESVMIAMVPLSYGGFVLFLPFSSHVMNLSMISYFLYLNFLPIYYEDRPAADPFLLIIIYCVSRFLTRMVFRERKEGLDSGLI